MTLTLYKRNSKILAHFKILISQKNKRFFFTYSQEDFK